MRPPCESIVTAVLPALRALVARELIDRFSFTQVEAASRLGITQAAISQYISEKRGNHLTSALESLPNIRTAVVEMAESIASATTSQAENIRAICDICGALKDNGIACSLHRDTTELPQDCNVCLK